MFLFNEYTSEYYKIIKQALDRLSHTASRKEARELLGYVEKHHIIPKSLGGTNDDSNLVWLTAAEHLKAHLLLVKMVDKIEHKRKMSSAAVRMANPQSRTHHRILADNEIEDIAIIRAEAARLHSEYMKERHKGENNPFYGRHHTEESKLAKSIANKGLPRTQQTRENIRASKLGDKNPSKKIVTCPHCGVTGKAGGVRKHHFDNCNAHLVYTFKKLATGELFTGTRSQLLNLHLSPKDKAPLGNMIHRRQMSVKGWALVNNDC